MDHKLTMGLLSFLATAALFVFGQLSSPFEAVSAQTLTTHPVSSVYGGTNVYIYNPASQSIISPVEYTNELVMVPWQNYNESMLWTLELEGSGPASYIYSAFPQFSGCPQGTTAQWDAEKMSPVTTVCSSAYFYDTFEFVPKASPPGPANTYVILALNNVAACVTDSNGVPVTPGNVCARLAASTSWQFVTIA